jgi:CheY-like chemotaxis protein
MPKKILLADDSVTIQKVISITLTSEDYELIVVGDGEAAIRKLKETKPDLVLLDVAMPGKNGYEVCDYIKKDPALSAIPVVLLAGTFEPLDREQAAKAGADDSIVKPFESQELLEKIRSVSAKAARKAGEARPGPREAAGVPAPPAQPRPSALERPPVFEKPEEVGEFGSFLGAEEEEAQAAEAPGQPELDVLGGTFFEEEAPKETTIAAEEFVDLELHEEEMKPREEPPMMAEPVRAPAVVREEPREGFLGQAFDIEAPEEGAPKGPVAEPFEVEPLEVEPRKEESFETDLLEVPREEMEARAVMPPVEPFRQARAPEPAERARAYPGPVAPAPQARFIEEAAARVAERVKEAPVMTAEGLGVSREEAEEIVKRVAREVVEEIAWEVIPELAEDLIMAEIARVKGALARPK